MSTFHPTVGARVMTTYQIKRISLGSVGKVLFVQHEAPRLGSLVKPRVTVTFDEHPDPIIVHQEDLAPKPASR